jgi:crotonobetainyl-CoA:carnitine CoA-transferase CaiB-like acyl-CoA transferase
VKFSNHETIYAHAAPDLGEHKHYILSKLLNYSDDEITSLESKNII